MHRAPTLSFTGFLLPLGTCIAIAGAPTPIQMAPAQSGPMVITTDTPEYCQQLLRRISELVKAATTPVPPRVSDLTMAGEHMCDQGQTRPGIMRLRSALMLMEKPNGPAY